MVHARGLVAVVAVGDQQLGAGQRRAHRLRRRRVGDAPQAVRGAVLVGDLGPRLARQVRRERAPRRPGGVVVEREDGGEVRARGAREPQPVLLRARVRALVRPDAAGPVVLDLHAREEAVARAAAAVRPGVVLRERPQRGRVVAHEDPVRAPALEHVGGVGVRVVALREVDLDDVVGRARDERGALVGVDHVVGRRDDRLQPADAVAVVVEGSEGLDVGHGRRG